MNSDIGKTGELLPHLTENSRLSQTSISPISEQNG